MKIVAIDASGQNASVALWEDGLIRAEYSIQYKTTHSQILLPMLEDIRQKTELDMNTVDAVAVAAGPGSFTGLRIGSATAKGLCFAIGAPIIEVHTLEGLAYNAAGCSGLVCPIMDARRNQTYSAVFRFSANDELHGFELITEKEESASDIQDVIDYLNERGEAVSFLGDGVPVFASVLKEKLTVPFTFLPDHMSRQRAASVATLGAQYFANGERTVAAENHAPVYLRLSQAERERMEQEANSGE